MKRYFVLAVLVVACWYAKAFSMQDNPNPLEPAVFLKTIIRTQPILQVLYLFTVDPTRRNIKLVHAVGDGCSREPVSSIVDHYGAYAGLNGNNYRRGGIFNGNPVDFLKIKNNLYADPGIYRSALCWNDNDQKAKMGCVASYIQLLIGGMQYPVSRVNQPCADNEMILYTPAFGSTTRTPYGTCEIIIECEHVVAISYAGNATIPKHGFVYAVGKHCAFDDSIIKQGLTALFTHKIFMNHNDKLIDITESDYIMSGAGVLIHDGKIVNDFTLDFHQDKPITHCADEVAADFSIPLERQWLIFEAHPRTAVGILPDGKWLFVVVDGRQPTYSNGISLPELARFMLECGCIDAINVGGGGCSTLYVAGEIVNSPSSTTTHALNQEDKLRFERPVCSAFVIV